MNTYCCSATQVFRGNPNRISPGAASEAAGATEGAHGFLCFSQRRCFAPTRQLVSRARSHWQCQGPRSDYFAMTIVLVHRDFSYDLITCRYNYKIAACRTIGNRASHEPPSSLARAIQVEEATRPGAEARVDKQHSRMFERRCLVQLRSQFLRLLFSRVSKGMISLARDDRSR